MQLTSPRLTKHGEWTRLTATARKDGLELDLYFEVPSRLGHYLVERLDGFVPPVAVLAPSFGERLIRVNEIDPDLLQGVETALSLLAHWYPDQYTPKVRVDAHQSSPPITTPRTAGSFLTGGIDSLATLRNNQLTHPPGHPMRIGAGVLVNFYAGSSIPSVQIECARYDALARRLQAFGEVVGIDVVHVRTNIMSLIGFEAWRGWGKARHGMFLGGAAHAISGGVSTVRIASSNAYVLGSLNPWGSHPLLDNELWSASMRLIHDGLNFSRSQKASVVAGWPEAIPALNVCTRPGVAQRWNCGSCEKCLRTAAALAVAGNLEAAESVRGRPLNKDEFRSVIIHTDGQKLFWEEIAETAERTGIKWVARNVRHAVSRYQRVRPLKEAYRVTVGSNDALRARVDRLRRCAHAGPRE